MAVQTTLPYAATGAFAPDEATAASVPAPQRGRASAGPADAALAAIARYGVPRALLSLVFGAPRTKVRTLRPSGYNAFIERITQPMLIVASIAMTTGAVFVMAQGLIQQASDAIGRGNVPSFENVLALATLFVIGFLIDTSLITSGSRFRMHALRAEWGWALLSAFMLLLCVGVEGMTWSYLLYQLEPAVLPPDVAAFIRGIPAVLFFVRAFMGPVCLIYLTAGVLPLTIQRGDVDRQTAAMSGSAIVAVINALIQQIQEVGLQSSEQAVRLLELLLTLFRVAAKHATEHEDHAMVEAFRNLSRSVEHLPAALELAAVSSGTSTSPAVHAVLQRLERATQRAAEDAGLDDDQAEEEDEDSDAVELAGDWDDNEHGDRFDRIHMITRAGARGGVTSPAAPRSLPRPGTLAFGKAVRQAILALQRERRPRTFYTIAHYLGEGVDAAEVEAAFQALRQARENRMRPDTPHRTDPALDDADLLGSSENVD